MLDRLQGLGISGAIITPMIWVMSLYGFKDVFMSFEDVFMGLKLEVDSYDCSILYGRLL